MNSNWIKTYVIQILPAISVIVYVLGFAYNITYYNEFGVNILSYITFGEVLVSSLTPIVFIILINMIGVMGLLLLSPGIRIMKREMKKVMNSLKKRKRICVITNRLNAEIEKIRTKNSNFNITAFAFSLSVTFALLCIIIPYLIYVDVVFIESYKYFVLAMASVAYSSCITLYLINFKRMKFGIVKNIVNTFILSVNSICLIIVVILVAYYNAEQDKNRTEKVKFEVVTENGMSFNDDKYNYINDCSNALFLYERSTKETIVIPINHILSIRHKGINKTFYHKVIDDINILYKVQKNSPN